MVHEATGRPKHPRFATFDEDERLGKGLRELPPAAVRYVAKQAGKPFRIFPEHGKSMSSFLYTESQVATVRRAIPEAKKHYKMLKKRSSIGRRDPPIDFQ